MTAQRQDNKGFLSDIAESRPEMASAVQGEDVLFTRLQSDMTQNILIEGLHAAAGSKDVDAADDEKRRSA